MTSVDDLIDSRPGFDRMEPAGHQSEATPVNDFIYMSPGTSNSYMVLTRAGRVIINTGMGFEALTHKRVFDAVCPGPTPYILLTQGHVDHVGGVNHFREPETKLVAQANNAQCQHDDERISEVRIAQAYIWFSKTIDKSVKTIRDNPDLLVQDKPVPDITFDDSYVFTHGGVDFELLATPGGETIDSCVVWLPEDRILFSGNMFGPLFPHFPNINTIRGDRYRFIEPYLESVKRVQALEPEMLITGHFEPIVGRQLIHDSMQRLYDAVDYVHRETLRRMNAGEDIYTLMRDIGLPPELRVGEGYGKVSWAVRTIWESYMGWFKARSTTELYPTQPRELYADVAELAGIDRLVQRGREKLDAGEPEAALHLAEMALGGHSAHRPALELSLDAHRALLERSGGDNFWESGWLKTSIATLEKQLQQAG